MRSMKGRRGRLPSKPKCVVDTDYYGAGPSTSSASTQLLPLVQLISKALEVGVHYVHCVENI